VVGDKRVVAEVMATMVTVGHGGRIEERGKPRCAEGGNSESVDGHGGGRRASLIGVMAVAIWHWGC